ncbi:hypothetical protein [Sulfuracidifex metallicus]|uniref:hypothetical protein n=1 Tax=Sulfuracidifex metallicus TaxID=47303 RepID=UPI0012EDCE9B|nr:hypothetical protein [Sulfuracidifex metallicus]
MRKADSLMEKLPSLLDRLSDYTRVGYSLRGSILRIIESSSNDITKDYLISFVKTLDKKMSSSVLLLGPLMRFLKH